MPAVTFTVNWLPPSDAPPPRAIVEDSTGREDEGDVQPIEKQQYAVRFVPHMNGAHKVSVLSGNRHVAGSPFMIPVGSFVANPAAVHATGVGLSQGVVGQKCTFMVNTMNAGSGPLTVNVDGPSRAQITSSEVDEGFEITYVPFAPGEYSIAVRFGGNFHIVASPFTAFITGIFQRYYSQLIRSFMYMIRYKHVS